MYHYHVNNWCININQQQLCPLNSINAKLAGFVTIGVHHGLVALAFAFGSPFVTFGFPVAAGQADAAFLRTRRRQMEVGADAVAGGHGARHEAAEPIIAAFRAEFCVGIESRRGTFVAAVTVAPDQQIAQHIFGVGAMTARFRAFSG